MTHKPRLRVAYASLMGLLCVWGVARVHAVAGLASRIFLLDILNNSYYKSEMEAGG